METPSKELVTPIRVVLFRSESEDFLQLPKVWSEPDRCGPHSTFFLDDPELRAIHDLGPAVRSKAITEGVIATIKALEVATVLNNASREGEIRANALSKERDALDVVKLGLDRAAAQLKVVNPDVDLCVEGIHHLSDVEGGVINPPQDFEEDIRHVGDAQANGALQLISSLTTSTCNWLLS